MPMYRLNGGAAVAGNTNSTPTIMSRLSSNGDFLMAAGVLGLVLVMVMPMPPQLLDLLLTALSAYPFYYSSLFATRRSRSVINFPNLTFGCDRLISHSTSRVLV